MTSQRDASRDSAPANGMLADHSGMYLPARLVHERRGAPAERHAAVTAWSTFGQFVVTLLALAISVTAAVFAYRAYLDQQSINKSQGMVNAIEQERFHRRYSSRVTMWYDPDKSRYLIRNGSPAPLTEVMAFETVDSLDESDARYFDWEAADDAEHWRQRLFYPLGDLPPCSLLALPEEIHDYAPSAEPQYLTVEELSFHDPNDAWIRKMDGTLLLSDEVTTKFEVHDGQYASEAGPDYEATQDELVPRKPADGVSYASDQVLRRWDQRTELTSVPDCGEAQ